MKQNFLEYLTADSFTQKFIIMKPLTKPSFKKWILVTTISVFIFSACQKKIDQPATQEEIASAANSNSQHGHLKQTKTFSSDVAIHWMNMQVRQMKANPTVTGNVIFARQYAYSGIALYEAVVPGMPAYQSISSQLNGLSGLPQTKSGAGYHWAASANAALAFMNKKLFPNASDANKTAMDSLENALLSAYSNETSEVIINRSVEYGKAVAQKVWDWANTDGYNEGFANDFNKAFTYSPDVTPGAHLWVPPAAWSIQTAPYWKNVRPIISGSGVDAQPGSPPAYSTDHTSAFYLMVKEVYDSKPVNNTTPEAMMALWWRDVPGTTTSGHFVSVLKQILEKEKPGLDVAALAYSMGGIMVFDASLSTWQTKFSYNLVRPITYIISQIGAWSPLLGSTPPHPEYPSAHSSLSAANAEAMTIVFGDNYAFSDNTFEYLWPGSTRYYSSFRAMADEAGLSRLYGGIHYRYSIDVGLWQGRKVAQNINNTLKFLKD